MAIHIQSFTINHFPLLMIAMSKPAYLAIKEHSPTKPIVIFVPSWRQCRLTVDNLLTHRASDEKPDLFLNIEFEDLQPHLDHINDKSLVETLKHGIEYYHETLDKQDKCIVQRLFESGTIQVLVASKVSHCSFVTVLAFLWLTIFDRIRLGVYLWLAIWPSCVCSSTRARNITTSSTPSWMFYR